ncbi:hypothetical protein M409DRAFT_55812 [Zasmidium cellare ATCC 36951]|uniref:Zn(2)-C6 fungal-type domain-containing protein n=1 Tax=Zasmidium cellare ATCC 36951 TaxID=1080233 RepID=A0A6A6CFJ1_ZASCE|nr:uncharacterized protein M409DRAFT_55812 [Zasmidium cellare ATCC 36951]KAF2165413.1 hypothetical protein M409DRAFT_55812 [Zasmidium cellare ATCC 36951]
MFRTCFNPPQKCDEKTPTCSTCQKGGRLCSYEHRQRVTADEASKVSIYIRTEDGRDHSNTGLRLRRTQKAASGQGSFSILALAKPAGPLSNADSELAGRWAYMLGPLPLDQASSAGFYGVFRTIPSRLGIDRVLSAAASYTVDSHWAFMTQDSQHLEKARRSGVRATRALRLAIQSPVRDLANAIPVAVLALKHAEYFMHLHTFTYQFHVIAQSALLKAQWSSGHWNELQEDIIRTVWLEEIEEAVFAGTTSELDDPLRHEVRARARLPENDRPTDMYHYCMEQCILIPRLVRLVRKCASDPDECLIQETVSLAERIYDRDKQAFYEDLLRQNTAVESRCQGPFNPLGRSLVFLSTRIFILTGIYYMYRNMICGLILRMLDTATVEGTVFDKCEIEHEDVRAAEHIVMCVEHAFNCSDGDPPFKAMRLHDPITMAFGAWSRLAKRECFPTCEMSSLERGRGGDMKEFCKMVVARIMDMWHAGPDLLEIFEATAEAFEGGPTLPGMSRRGKAWRETLS